MIEQVNWATGLEIQAFEIQAGREFFYTLYPVPTPINFWDEYFSLSPLQTYRVECLENDTLRLFKNFGNLLIYEQPELETSCGRIEWREDDVAFSFTTDDGNVYVWRMDGKAPYQVAVGAIPGSRAAWSPDGLRLTVPRLAETGVGTVDIAYLYNFSQYATHIQFDCCNEWEPYIPWITNDIVKNGVFGLGYSHLEYFDINTGKLLVSYGREIFWDGTSTGNFASFSPDKQWLVVDDGNYYNSFEPENPKISYSLFDTNSKSHYLLTENPELVITFLDWQADSSKFYVVSHPFSETSPPDPLIPSGLLALDPNTRQFTQLIPGAMYATLNPQQSHALTFILTNGQLTAALYTLSGDLLATFQPVTNEVPYLFPGEGLPIPAAWSNDGTQIVFSDVWGDLWLADTSGSLIQLADNLGFDPAYPHQPKFSWSPDDTHLLITFNERAWVITVP